MTRNGRSVAHATRRRKAAPRASFLQDVAGEVLAPQERGQSLTNAVRVDDHVAPAALGRGERDLFEHALQHGSEPACADVLVALVDVEGDPAMRSDANLVYKAKRWVMR